MKRVLLYNFSGELDDVSHLFPNERLARLAGILRGEGVDVSILDRANFKDLIAFGPAFMEALGNLGFDESSPEIRDAAQREAQGLASGGYDTVFAYLWHGSGFKFTVEVLHCLRRILPDVAIYGIGQKVDWFTHHILDLTGNCLNGLVRGLGYDTVRHLAAGGAPGTAPDLMLRGCPPPAETTHSVIDVDDYPPPCYAPDVYQDIDAKIPIFPISLSNEACPNRCVYCVRPENYGRSLRRRDPATVLAEMEMLHRDFGVTHFRVQDSTPPRGALTALATALQESPLRGIVRMAAFARVDVHRDEDFRLLRDAGFIAMFFGIESLDPETLVHLQKGITVEAVTDTLHRAHEAGIFTVGSFIFPLPGATAGSMKRTLDRLAGSRQDLDALLLLPAGIYPPTPWGRAPEQYGIRLDPDYIRKSIVYPIKYLIPLRQWKPLPFSYDLMGKPASEVSFSDIVDAQEAFSDVARNQLKIPAVPDHYVLLASLAGHPPADFARLAVGCISRRDYAGLRDLCRPDCAKEPPTC